jgi:hypothetical protein
MKHMRYLLALWFIAALAGCNLPGQPAAATEGPGAVFTRAAETVAAELTRVALAASPTPNLPTNTFTPVPTNTPAFTSTFTPIPCNLAQFVDDVTIDDYSEVNPGATFNKIWRLRNIGSCTWTTAYKVFFDDNNSMGLPAGYSQPLTMIVPPGQTVDISVNLTAPVANGTYRGDYSLREPGGQKITTFIVIIKVDATPHTVTLTALGGEGGTVNGNAEVFPGDVVGGDSSADFSLQGFASFDISSIPNTAAITLVKVDLVSAGYVIDSAPFVLGCLRLYPQDYGTLDAGDFFGGALASPYVEWCNESQLIAQQADGDLRSLIQSRLGTTRIRVRFQFQTSVDPDGVADAVHLTAPKLIVSYNAP